MLGCVPLVRTNVPSKHQILQEPNIVNFPQDSILYSHCHEDLKSYIVLLYGEATHQHIRQLETLRIKRTKLLSALPFLLTCRDHNTIPNFLQFHHHINSDAVNRIYRCTSFSLLHEWIQYTRQELDAVLT
jgi:hypothetical protein